MFIVKPNFYIHLRVKLEAVQTFWRRVVAGATWPILGHGYLTNEILIQTYLKEQKEY